MGKYTLEQIRENPKILTYRIPWSNGILVLRPLEADDVEVLSVFLSELSPETRKNYKLENYGIKTAEEFCSSIAHYDKLRLLLLKDTVVIGPFEFSMDIPESDVKRFSSYNTELNDGLTCRFGPCLADKYQGKGIAKAVFPFMKEITIKTGNKRILLWGGVFRDNKKAVKHYESIGFVKLGEFVNQDGRVCFDMLMDL
ncbi:hypothetical protein A3K34_04900 [candidate division WWE3 bacterium RIFOXYC1_FULL_40_10]|uniref:N-acetyltransferase domain-containing protein n=1 Tax=candidate division WWE3 bacterium RIFOXYA2_FULL_46_9 TaxID=1802636 RepID=A0A1F4W187_UNCKA|nr:MAG: hypothetical protein A3K58_04900 [candidate division WWE3 bacterium RIFOXYB1_FULL_40_22]OGC62176.1 MAG: hypothetical protein A3K37_04900 [candidate division WWE3 bacterium RIFOXYA1_FULL_40_11]OGC63189.1 MAG: hypothetical protein A2264_00655 [candidate division WWE3 bacterium RIFOXYA2_FULL_46_9]OGC65270.1 MAG: hypothetical protein A2326_04285 [candidate division WWE3 bacterium RIFOXYB2_FULL_41_6]OGC66559.1 MAG: hypothetical protein A3K34_04900 [candidate division WWE3 bacterium RIFOXYC1_